MIKKIVFAKQPKNEYLKGDAVMDLFQVIAHEKRAVYIKYLVEENGDLKELFYVSREELKAEYKHHVNEYIFNSLDELDDAIKNDFFKLRKKRLVAYGDIRYTYILV